jgi:hypothetical protein
MKSLATLALSVLLLTSAAAVPAGVARAGEAADITRRHFEAGSLAEGEQVLAGRVTADAADGEARFGLGMIRFARALERFGQHHYRYGLQPLAERIVPFLRMPVPPNPKAERLTYEAQRAALQALIDGLTAAEATLAALGEADVKIPLDLERVRLDITGVDGAPKATLMDLVRSIAPVPPRPPTPPSEPPAGPEPFEVAFDRADALWLRGYCRLLSAALEFILAHDWRSTFDAAAPLFYPNLRPDGALDASSLDDMTGEMGSAGAIADAIALIHAIHWEPIEPARLRTAREHLKTVAAFSRASWQAILAETDDDREWIPAPRQQNRALPAMPVTEERVRTWLAALDDFEAVLDGRRLLPHWRMAKGVNLRRVFEEPRKFDIVLWATGHAALPYLEDGPIIPSESWQLWQQVFEGNFLAFALYFN